MVEDWEAVATEHVHDAYVRHELEVKKEVLSDDIAINSHVDAIHLLKLQEQVIPPGSLGRVWN